PARSSPKSARCLTSTRSAQRTSMSRKVTPKARSCSKLRTEIGGNLKTARQIFRRNGKLDVVSRRGDGLLSKVAIVQRINTHGGVAQGSLCNFTGGFRFPYRSP